MSNHFPISDEALLAYVLGEGTEQAREEVAKAERSDSAVWARVEAYRELLGDLKVASAGELAGLFEVSREQRAKLSGLMKQQESLVDRVSKAVRQVAALLVFDSARADVAGAGFRGAVAERVLRFECDAGTVDLRLSEVVGERGGGSGGVEGREGEERGTVLIQGELALLGLEAGAAARVRLVLMGAESGGLAAAASAEVIDGYFEIWAAAGTYSLMISTPGQELLMQPLVIEPM